MANSRRVRWLERGYRVLREELLPDAPARACVSVSVTTRRTAIGQCFNQYVGPDGRYFLAIHPRNFTSALNVLKTELHEMIHTVAKDGHGPEFRRIARAVGFTAPWTSTPATDDLAKHLERIAERLGPLPKADWLQPEVPVPMVTLECACPRTLTVTSDFLKGGNVKCMKCHRLFRKKRG